MAVMIQAENIVMEYPGVEVLKGVNFSASAGEIHAIVGRNASGKTTLGLIVSGARSPTGGRVSFDGKRLSGDRNEAEKRGIFMVEQTPILFPDLELYANIIYGHEKQLFGNNVFMPSRARMLEFSKNILNTVGLNIDPHTRTGKLSEGELQLLNIARVLACKPRVLILDEFSASLTRLETARIFEIIKQMREEGKCIVLISHNLNEITKNCDKVSIFDKNGALSEHTIDEARQLPLADLMFGNESSFKYPYLPIPRGKIVLSVKDLNMGILKNISFNLYQGELLGIAGLVGSGRSTLVKAILNHLNGVGCEVGFFDFYSYMSDNRPGMVPENSRDAMFHFSSVGENVIISNLRKACKGPLLSSPAEKMYALDAVDRLGIIPRDISAYPDTLSSGNKQKLAIARLLFSNSNVIFFDEPTKNIDAAGKVDFYNILNHLRQNGGAAVLISSDFSELMGMCSRILALRNGRQVGEITPCDSTLEALYKLVNNEEDPSE